MSDNNLIAEFLTRVVDAEMADADHWLLTDIFYRALPRPAHYERFWNDWESATDRSVIYEWWSEYLETAVSNEFLRKFLDDNLYDEYIYSFLIDIHDKYETHIKKHYEDMCYDCGDKSIGTYGEDNKPLCAEHKEEGGFCSCGDIKKECDLCGSDDESDDE